MEFSRSSSPIRIQIPAQHDLEPIVQAGEQLGITTIPLGTTDLWCDDALLVAKMFLRLEPESQEAIHMMSGLLNAINRKTERK